MQAAAIYEQQLHEPSEALEAMLRALALDMQNRELLSEIDRLAAQTGAWERLARVYARLVQQASGSAPRSSCSRATPRCSSSTRASPRVALERLLEVCKLAPERNDLLERAEALAVRAGTPRRADLDLREARRQRRRTTNSACTTWCAPRASPTSSSRTASTRCAT